MITTVCDGCGRESDDLRARLLFHDWKGSILAGSDPVERERPCPRCRRIERIKSAVGIGLLLSLALGVAVATFAAI
jgi:hypothetical protein